MSFETANEYEIKLTGQFKTVQCTLYSTEIAELTVFISFLSTLFGSHFTFKLSKVYDGHNTVYCTIYLSSFRVENEDG